MSRINDLSRSFTAFEQDSTLVVVVEVSLSSWLVAGILPGVARQPLKKLGPDEDALLALIHRWRDEASRSGSSITRICLAYEAGRDGFWLARWLLAHDVESYVIHSASVSVSREHRRAKTDRLDTELLKRSFLGWLRGERGHCSMAAVPTVQEEDSRRPNREREKLVGDRTRIVNRIKATLVRFGIRTFKPTLRNADERLNALRTAEGVPLLDNTRAELRRDMARLRMIQQQIKEIEQQRLRDLEATSSARVETHTMVRLLAHEILSRNLRDRQALARYAGLTGSPDESGNRRREKGLSRAGNARVRRGMIQLAWRFLQFQKESALAHWYRERTADRRSSTRKTMIVALARKLLIALWQLATTGQVPEGVLLRSAS